VLVVVAAVLGAGPLLASPAGAEPTEGATVTFTGQVDIQNCESRPDAARKSVYSRSIVEFRNELGAAATLSVNGQPVGEVASGEAFYRLVAQKETVSMRPNCDPLATESVSAVTIHVVPRPAPTAPTQAPPPATEPADATAPASAEPDETGPGGVSGGGVWPSVDADASEPATYGVGDPAALPAGNAVALDRSVPAAPARSGVNGLLALVAVICLGGVSLAAIQTILTSTGAS
jgi:hypothetical protein